MKKFTERDTEEYYDREDEIYQTFWDEGTGLHWGLFNGNCNFNQASQNTTDFMIKYAKFGADSNILEVGSGNGTISIQLAEKFKSKVKGIDLSGIRVENAKELLKTKSKEIQKRVLFEKSSATHLPFKDETFSHVWSQATIYHVHDKEKALKEIYRVLKKGGIFVFDDLFKPKEELSEDAQKYVYERLLFDTPFNFKTYKQVLGEIGFEIIESFDVSKDLEQSYEVLRDMLKEKIKKNEAGKFKEGYKKLILAYDKTAEAVKNNEVGWGIFVCKKK